MQLLQPRTFGEYFSDTFKFLKHHGAHFSINYLIVVGLSLVLYLLAFTPLVLSFFNYFDPALEPEVIFKAFFEAEKPMLIFTGILMLVVGILFGVVNLSFAPVYFKLFTQKNNPEFKTVAIIDGIKANFVKGLKAIVGLLILSIPLLILLCIAIVFVACTIVGMYIPIAAFVLLFTFTVYEYFFDHDNRFFDSFSKAWKLLFSKFWHSTGCAALIMLIGGIVQQIFSALLQFVMGINSYTTNTNEIPDSVFDIFNTEMIAMLSSTFFITLIISFVINIITHINHGIIYYSLKEAHDHIAAPGDEIDQLGQSDY
jgi:hypothetical protein